MAEIVYLLGTLTSAACAVLLLRAHRRWRGRLLLFSGLCFVGLALNNALLFIDRSVVPDVDLSLARGLAALGGVVVLLHGLIQEGR